MSLPGSRDFDAVDSGPLPAATVNNIQDSIIGAGHGVVEKFFDMAGFRSLNVTSNVLAGWIFAGPTSPDRLMFMLPLRPGDRLLEWSIYVTDDPGPVDRVLAGLYWMDPFATWAPTQIGVDQISDGSGTDQKIGQDLTATPHVVVADQPLELQVRPDPTGALNAANNLFVRPVVLIKWDHP